MSNYLYHITTASEWESAQKIGVYEAKGFEREGFIHCSYPHQLVGVANRFFKGQTNLVILVIDPAALVAEVIVENLQGGAELFPHVYGKIETAAVVKTVAIESPINENLVLPDLSV